MASDTDTLQFWLFRLSSSLVSSCLINISRKSELLFDLLQELIFLKDAERLLLRMRQLGIEEQDEKLFLHGIAEGEPLDAERHHQRADVKAVTLHDFSVERAENGWKARVLLDI